MSVMPDREGQPKVYSLFQGDFSDGMRHGFGTFKDQVGQSEYTGEWKQDSPHGFGQVGWADGATFCG